jgi:hypothetical protein
MSGSGRDLERKSTEKKARDLGVVRRPYRAPRLQHLGSVRELTLGATGPNNDVPVGTMMA